jgi:hypothetical protein
MELIVLLGAESDIQVAFNRFEEYREGVGLKFLQELELAYEYHSHGALGTGCIFSRSDYGKKAVDRLAFRSRPHTSGLDQINANS